MDSVTRPASSSVFDLRECACAPSEIRFSTSAFASAPSFTITTSKFRARSFSASASNWDSDAGSANSTAAIAKVFSLQYLLEQLYKEQDCALNLFQIA